MARKQDEFLESHLWEHEQLVGVPAPLWDSRKQELSTAGQTTMVPTTHRLLFVTGSRRQRQLYWWAAIEDIERIETWTHWTRDYTRVFRETVATIVLRDGDTFSFATTGTSRYLRSMLRPTGLVPYDVRRP